MSCLFVYGTLAPGRSNEHVLAPLEGTWEPATVRGTLFPEGWGASEGYPALVPSDDGPEVPGLVFSSPALEEHWARIDAFEGEGYDRVSIQATLATGATVEAFVYALRGAPSVPPLIASVDVDYGGDVAVAAGVWFRGWEADTPASEALTRVAEVEPYVPGAFYRRELPCLLAVLAHGPKADVVVVDGHVWLARGVPGLGARLQAEIGGVVVGVAKRPFAGATLSRPVLRGLSREPLHVSVVGASISDAARWVVSMHGPHRLPTLLRRADRLARGLIRPGASDR